MNQASRRQFLQIGLAATAWPIVARTAHAAGLEPRPGIPFLGLVYDTRFAESVEFARHGEALGLRPHAIDGDMTRLWYDEIYHHWRRRPTALAGLTAHGPMFCFAELARDVGMRLVFRAEHRPTAGGAMAHTFTGPASMLPASLDACDRPGSLWAAMAAVVAACPGGRVEMSSGERTDASPRADASARTATLYTWVIAPASRA